MPEPSSISHVSWYMPRRRKMITDVKWSYHKHLNTKTLPSKRFSSQDKTKTQESDNNSRILRPVWNWQLMIKVMFPLHGRDFFFCFVFPISSGAQRLIFRQQKPSTYSAYFFFFFFFFYNHDGETAVHEHTIPQIPSDKYIEGLRQLGSLHSR